MKAQKKSTNNEMDTNQCDGSWLVIDINFHSGTICPNDLDSSKPIRNNKSNKNPSVPWQHRLLFNARLRG